MAIGIAVSTRQYRKQRALRSALQRELDRYDAIDGVLRESEARHRAITETAQDAIVATDADGKVSFWNAAAERIFGYRGNEVLGQNLLDLIVPPQYHEAKRRGMAAFAQTGQGAAIGSTLELTALRKSGEEFPIEISISCYRDGGAYRAVALVREISERKRVEENLARHRTLLEAVNAVLQETLECDTRERLAHVCLKKAETLTGSAFGFIGELNEQGNFDTLALSNPGGRNAGSRTDPPPPRFANMPLRGLWATTIESGMPQIFNDLSSAPQRTATPPGHPELTAFLGVPLKRADRVVGNDRAGQQAGRIRFGRRNAGRVSRAGLRARSAEHRR